jgi:hypothetical protein
MCASFRRCDKAADAKHDGPAKAADAKHDGTAKAVDTEAGIGN